MTEYPSSSFTKVQEMLTPDAQVTFYPLSMRAEDNQYIVGRMETGAFVMIPEVGGRSIELLQRGCSLKEAQALLQAEYGEEIDLDAFMISLVDLGFVISIDGHHLGFYETVKPSLAWLQPRHVRWLFSWPVRIFYIAVVLAAGFALITHSELIPHYQDFFWLTTTSLVIAGNTAIFITRAALHELAHLVSARSLGIFAHINLSTRLHYLVVQTDVTGLWTVPRSQRYRVYLAGLLSDLALVSVALLLLAYIPLPVLAQQMLRALILLSFFGMVGQFHFYMRTDIYFVVQDLLRCYNMFGDALAYLRYRTQQLWLIISRRTIGDVLVDPLAHLQQHERQKVRIYAWLVLAGSGVALLLFAGYGLPILIGILMRGGISAWRGITLREPWLFLDGAATILIEVSFQIAFFIAFFKNHRHWFSILKERIARGISYFWPNRC